MEGHISLWRHQEGLPTPALAPLPHLQRHSAGKEVAIIALIPISLFFEFVFIVFGFILMEMRLPGRMAALGAFAFTMMLATQDQVYVQIDSGTLTNVTGPYPSSILGILAFAIMIFEYLAIASIFEYVGRDMVGRKR